MRIWSALLLLASCSTLPATATSPDAPYVLVLGTAQDAGLPQIGCRAACCETARADPTAQRLVASLLIVDPRTQQRWLIDATPDLAQQVEAARGHPPGRAERLAAAHPGERPALFEGVFLTHAHMGHYSGLVQLGREAYDAKGLPVHCTPSLGHYLAHNGPWSQLVDRGAITLKLFRPGQPIVLSRDGSSGAPLLTVTALAVPHRHEFSDTVGYRIDGPNASLLYIPDIDKWPDVDKSPDNDKWPDDEERPDDDKDVEGSSRGTGVPSLSALLSSVDVALLDGSFYADGEIPGRSMADIPHPFISETLALLRRLPSATRARLVFTHLNHTNPAAQWGSEAHRAVEAAGAQVARDGELFSL